MSKGEFKIVKKHKEFLDQIIEWQEENMTVDELVETNEIFNEDPVAYVEHLEFVREELIDLGLWDKTWDSDFKEFCLQAEFTDEIVDYVINLEEEE